MSDEPNEKDAHAADASMDSNAAFEQTRTQEVLGDAFVPRQLEVMLGRRDLFAVKVAFLPDPDAGRATRISASPCKKRV